MADDNEVMRALGRIEGQLKGMNQRLDIHSKSLVGMDARIRNLEQRAAARGALAGGVMATGIALISESLKAAFRMS